MADQTSRAAFAGRGITLKTLQEQQYALNRQLLLAIRLHDTETQERLQGRLTEVQEQIRRMSLRI